ncbi:hypothetical protein [Devosia sp. FKR38]|uniref:hypothetical protein n=1 Tax=Devosia sp. FKR38 TaxID=2562312 RepID=UPI0020C111A0|nr:hypothetical protein [Devosia sp. FKR38]
MNKRFFTGACRAYGFALFALLASAPAALAQQSQSQTQPPSPEQKEACMQDFRRLCPGTMPGGGRVKQCFADHYEQLSPLCQAAFDASATAG